MKRLVLIFLAGSLIVQTIPSEALRSDALAMPPTGSDFGRTQALIPRSLWIALGTERIKKPLSLFKFYELTHADMRDRGSRWSAVSTILYRYVVANLVYYRSRVSSPTSFWSYYVDLKWPNELWNAPRSKPKSLWADRTDIDTDVDHWPRKVWRYLRSALRAGQTQTNPLVLLFVRRTIANDWPALGRLMSDDDLLVYPATMFIVLAEFNEVISAFTAQSAMAALTFLALMGGHNRRLRHIDREDGAHYRALAAVFLRTYASAKASRLLAAWAHEHRASLGLFLNGLFVDRAMSQLPIYLGPQADVPWREILWLALWLYVPTPDSPVPSAFLNWAFLLGNEFYYALALWNETHPHHVITPLQALSGHPLGDPFWRHHGENQFDVEWSQAIARALHALAVKPDSVPSDLHPHFVARRPLVSA